LASDFRDFGSPSGDAAGGGKRTRRWVYSSDLDLNRHVNNVNTIRWILDSQGPMVAGNRGVGDFSAAFLSEAFCGEEVLVYSELLEDEDDVLLSSVTRVETGEEVCRARVRWTDWG
jgi:acyl-ACP thioesterase